MTIQFRPATRTDAKPLIALYSISGAGKTFSSLLLARGIVGAKGKIAMIDTESGRGSLYADMIPGGYDTFNLSAPFSPERYIETIEAAEKVADIAIIDSTSHEWEGIGGILDMAAANEQRMGKKSLSIWAAPKQAHSKLVLKLLQASIPIIVCLRAKYKTRQIKVNGRTEVVKDDSLSPIQDESFIFEMMAHAEIKSDHSINLTKCSHPELRACFPESGPITVEHGKLIAEWAKGGESQAAELMDTARKIAAKGKDAFTKYWKKLDKKQRAILKPIIPELKETAERFDNPKSEGDDPFSEGPRTNDTGQTPDRSTEAPNAHEGAGTDDGTHNQFIIDLEAATDRETIDNLEADHAVRLESESEVVQENVKKLIARRRKEVT